jgi:hypothetical protein
LVKLIKDSNTRIRSGVSKFAVGWLTIFAVGATRYIRASGDRHSRSDRDWPEPMRSNLPFESTARAQKALIAAASRKLQEQPLHRVYLGDVGRNEMISAPFARDHLKMTAGVSGGGTSAAEMD